MKQWLLKLFQFSAIVTFLLSIAGFWGELSYLLEITVHFKWQYLAIGCLISLFFLVRGQPVWLIFSLCIVLLNLSFVLPWYLPANGFSQLARSTNTNSNPLKILLANVNIANQNYADTLDLIQSTNPDLFAIVETNQNWLDQVAMSGVFPYSIQSPNAGNFGVALYSKFPLKPVNVPTLPASTVSRVQDYHVAATVEIDQTSVTFIAIHPPPPITAVLTNLRNQELQIVGDFVEKNPSATVILGDLNTTMWTTAYRQFEQHTNLKNARKGFGILPTWTTRLPLLFIPIDHILIGSNFTVLDIKTGKNLGSDHLPLIVELAQF
ncbi:MAG: endonuclease/exonuclease/phosphatase family protein [Cyanobacteria bacterium RM1_2_2]|nr:endonuclease/exonuclease/phosphatase family protein [Cyanobacteria bacterium RM1_2_2]